MQAVIFGIRVRFPGVSHVTTDELAAQLAANDGASPPAADGQQKETTLLLDARAPEEFSVSHLLNAVNVDYKDPEAALRIVREANPDRVVCYCSVGYRSASLAQQLSSALAAPAASSALPAPEVHNLEGSLFKWANERRPMVDAEGSGTGLAHPYSAMWGRLLLPELRKWAA